MRPTNSVVKLASIIEVNALSYPFDIACFILAPFLNSSFILSKISTLASMDIPIVSTIPAMPGSVREADSCASIPRIKNILKNSAKLATIPPPE